ncbi:selenium metabolism-associated LysR family transcriptional regulator [Thermodesulfobacteriota bacterium]
MPPIDFDLRQLEIFCKVVELQSFSKAADAVFLTQASVSERIANLEKAIGTLLLDRLGRQIVPTKAGELLYKHSVLLLDMKKTACLEMESFLGLRQGEIHLGGSTIPGEYILPKVIGRFYEKYPFVSVILTIADTSEIECLVREGDLELGVIGSKNSYKDLLYYELWKDELVLTVYKGHKWVKKSIVTLDELLEEPFILRETGSGTLKIIEDYFKSSGLEGINCLKTVARLGTSTAVKEGIKSGLGVSILSSRALETELEAGTLKTVKIKGFPNISRSFYLIRDKRRIASPLCQAMLDFLQVSSKEANVE